MSVHRLSQIQGFNIDRVAAAAGSLGLDCQAVSDRLLVEKVAATPMRGCGGEVAERHVRFVFSSEPVERLGLLGVRVRAALAAAGATS